MPHRARPKKDEADAPAGFYVVESPSGSKAVPSGLRWATEPAGRR